MVNKLVGGVKPTTPRSYNGSREVEKSAIGVCEIG